MPRAITPGPIIIPNHENFQIFLKSSDGFQSKWIAKNDLKNQRINGESKNNNPNTNDVYIIIHHPI